MQKFPEWDFQPEPKVNELTAQEVGNGEASEKHREFPSGWVPESLSEAHEFGLDPVILIQSVSLHLMRLIIMKNSLLIIHRIVENLYTVTSN